MLTISEIIVLLWMVPVVANIMLPLAVLGGWSIGRVIRQAGRRATSAAAEDILHPPKRQVLQTAGN